MLVFSLIFSALVLVAVNIAAGRTNRPVVATAGVSLLASLGTAFFCMSWFPPVTVQCLLLCVAGSCWRSWGSQCRRNYLAISIAVTVLSYVSIGISVADRYRSHEAYRERFAYKSLEERLPNRPATAEVSNVHLAGLDDLESAIESESMGTIRRYQLKRIHEHSVALFVDSPGFGVSRMSSEPTEYGLTHGLHDNTAPAQPADGDPSSLVPSGPVPPYPSSRSLNEIHAAGLLDFLHPRGFGYFKDRQHVAGFEPHGFSQVPASQAQWEVARLELVGLLLNKEPVVYVTPRLPRMDELRDVARRPLDAFELKGIEQLEKGESLFIHESRMMGAIRSTKQCLQCHGGNRGDLLGAFTYTLRPVKSP